MTDPIPTGEQVDVFTGLLTAGAGPAQIRAALAAGTITPAQADVLADLADQAGPAHVPTWRPGRPDGEPSYLRGFLWLVVVVAVGVALGWVGIGWLA